MNVPAIPQPFIKRRLREVHERQVLRLADSSFTIRSKELHRRLVHLDREADDGSRTTLIGVPSALISLCEGPDYRSTKL